MSVEPCTLIIRNRDAGFFSNFNAVLNNLRHGIGRAGIEAALVDWQAPEGSREFAYGQPAEGNLWTHFFEPLPFERPPAATCEASTFASWEMTGLAAYALYKLGGS